MQEFSDKPVASEAGLQIVEEMRLRELLGGLEVTLPEWNADEDDDDDDDDEDWDDDDEEDDDDWDDDEEDWDDDDE